MPYLTDEDIKKIRKGREPKFKITVEKTAKYKKDKKIAEAVWKKLKGNPSSFDELNEKAILKSDPAIAKYINKSKKTKEQILDEKLKRKMKICRECDSPIIYSAVELSQKIIKSICNDCQSVNCKLQKYKITKEEYECMVERGCALCGSKDSPHIDHCHETGKTRDLLCSRCNFGLGWFKDSPTLLLKAAEYLILHGKSINF